MEMPEKINTLISRITEKVGHTGSLSSLKTREKIITAVCRTTNGIEWSSFRIKQEETELLQQETVAVPFSGETSAEVIASLELPEETADQIQGDITVPLRTAELLMRVMELPAIAEDEITDMVEFQVDKISPFPIDQIAVSHEILRQTEDTSTVLLVAAQRSCIDSIGDTFAKQNIHIHSIDSRILGWFKLLQDGNQIPESGCSIFILDDGVDFSLVIIDEGLPIAFRMLHAQSDDMNIVEELIDEIEYTLTTLDTERDIPNPATIEYWSLETPVASMRTKLAERSGLKVNHAELGSLPPLSEGIVRRALADESRVELIPTEWIEHQKRKELQKKSIVAASVVLIIWLVVLLSLFTTYKIRDLQLAGVKKRAEAIAPAADIALQNRKKLRALKDYTDRSESSLECLREVTQLMPEGDLEFLSYKYDKGKGISLRGSALNDTMVDDYFIELSKSSLFEELKNQSSSKRVSKGISRQIYSVTLVLPAKENES